MSGYTIIDVDTHVTEMPDVWTSRVPVHMRDSVPRVDTDARGSLWWYLGDKRIAEPRTHRHCRRGRSEESSQELRGNAPRSV